MAHGSRYVKIHGMEKKKTSKKKSARKGGCDERARNGRVAGGVLGERVGGTTRDGLAAGKGRKAGAARGGREGAVNHGARDGRVGERARGGAVRGERADERARTARGERTHGSSHDGRARGGATRDERAREHAHSTRGAARPQGCELCAVFGRCGGCSQLDVPYERQLVDKQRSIHELFADLAEPEAFRPILGMESPFHYRNKVISPYAPGHRLAGGARAGKQARGAKGDARRDGLRARDAQGSQGAQSTSAPRREVLTGMYARGTHELIPTDTCALENEVAKKVTLAVRDLMRKWDIAPYDEDVGCGFMRHAVVRVGHASGEVLVTLVTNDDEFPSSKSFCRELVRRVPSITTVVQNINLRQTNVILGEKERTLFGPGFILDTLCGLSFRISSRSFYQVNAVQTEVLYDTAVKLADLRGSETVIDAYCGTGTIGLVAAKRGAGRVIGVDNVESAIRDARENARHNGVENAEFMALDAGAFLSALAVQRADVDVAERMAEGRRSAGEDAGANDAAEAAGNAAAGNTAEPSSPEGDRVGQASDDLVLMMDPPRAGSTERFLDAAARLAPSRIVYISCNPATQARDVAYLAKRGYRVEVVQPVDMFPHTDHVECVCKLVRKA